MPNQAGYAGLGLAAVLLGGPIGSIGCEKGPSPSGEVASASRRMVAAASIFPIADALRQVGGDRVEVLTLLPPGRTPHGYEPAPAQAERLATAKLLVVVGLGLDDWARRSAAAAGSDAPRILDLGATVGPAGLPEGVAATTTTAATTGPTSAPGHSAYHHAGQRATDPHIWLDPVRMIRITDAIAGTLGEIDPDGAATYAANAARFQTALRELDTLCATQLKALPRKEFVTLHAAFGHFAARYGLKEIAIRLPHAEGSGPKQLEEVVSFIRKHRVRFVFAEPQFPVDRLDAIARQTGVGVDRLDPLGAPGITGHDGYIELMKTNLATLVEGLSK